MTGLTSQGLAVAFAGVAALADTRLRLKEPTAALWPAFVVDGTMIAVAAPIAGIPAAALLAAYAYLGTAALLFVETRTALALLGFMGAELAVSAAIASASGLDSVQRSTAGALAGGVTWTVFLFGLVWIATRTVNAFHSQRESDRQRLEHLIREKDTFVATVSHELRTPMTAVIGLAQQLSEPDQAFTELERRELTELVLSQAQEATDIIEDLLVTARIEGGNIDVNPSAIDLNKEAALVLQALPRGNTISLITSPSGAPAHADPLRVRQIIRNLASNALRYGETPIIIAVEPGHVTVTDHGPGIPQRDRDRIFEPYGRSDTIRHPDSIGLGLFLSRTVANLMDGNLAYQRNDDKSIFHLTLPTTS